uniref:Uncharacterized protein n=1 Tax=Arundo donax TaxID=35708 RepID=A0A0A8YH91_ARUDO
MHNHYIGGECYQHSSVDSACCGSIRRTTCFTAHLHQEQSSSTP